jgi:MarR family transcriptional regulator, transcriptional regulator for hemolysin
VVTAKAEPILGRLRALAEEMSGEAFAGMSVEEIEAMRAKLARIRENVSRAETAQKGVA